MALTGKADKGYGGDFFAGSPEKHFSAKAYINKYGQELWQQYFTFSIVRNPWDRIISWVRYRDVRHKRAGELTPERIIADVKMPFIQRSSFEELLFEDGQLLVDFVGRFENLGADFQHICHHLNIPAQPLPHINKTDHNPYWTYYNEEAIELVGELFKQDIAYFGYEFGK